MTELAKQFATHYLTTTDYAISVGMSRQAVHKAIKKGRLKAVKVGRTWYVQKNTTLDTNNDT